MKFQVLAVAAALTLSPVAIAQSGSQLIKSVSKADMERLVLDNGHTVDSSSENDGSPYVSATDPNTGLKYALYGTACADARCNGIEFISTWRATDYNSNYERLNRWNLSKAAVTVALQTYDDGRKSVMVSRYLILDNGQTFDNLLLNANVFVNIATALGKEFTAQ